jgi:hypothetical protein
MKKHLHSISKKIISKVSLSISGVLLTVAGFGQIIDTLPESHNNPHGFGETARSTYTYSSGDSITYFAASDAGGGNFNFVQTAVTTSTSSALCAPSKRRLQVNSFDLTLNSTSVSKMVITGTSSGTSARTLRAIYVNGVIVDPTTYTVTHSFPTDGSNTSNTCGDITINNLNVALGSTVRVVIGSSPASTPQNMRLNVISLTPSVLPVRLLSFDAINRTNGIEVMWKADNETEGKSYSVERSNNGVAFEELKKIETMGAGTYSYLDNTAKLGPVAYYRLKMISVDGEKTYSKIKAVVINGANTLSISPNPVRGNSLNATFKPFTEPTTVKILNTSGKVLLTQQIAPFTSQSSINTTGLSKGVYMIQFVNGTEVKTSRFLKD